MGGLASGKDVARGSEQIAESKWFGEPAAPAVLEKSFGFGSGHISGHNDAAPRRGQRGQFAKESDAVDLGIFKSHTTDRKS
jgi:hypothetical protein